MVNKFNNDLTGSSTSETTTVIISSITGLPQQLTDKISKTSNTTQQMAGTLNMQDNKITTTYAPVDNSDLTNKLFVDALVSDLDFRVTTNSTNSATNSNLSVSNLGYINQNTADILTNTNAIASAGGSGLPTTGGTMTGTLNLASGVNITYDSIVSAPLLIKGTNNLTSQNAGSIITTGTNNTLIGSGAGNGMTTHSNNVGFGYASLNRYEGTDSVAIGYASLSCSGFKGIVGMCNNAIGMNAMKFQVSGINNDALGFGALENCNAGGNNTCIGYTAGSNITTENNNICIGSLSDVTVGVQNSIAIGPNSLATASSQLMLGGINEFVSAISTDIGSVAKPFNRLRLSGNSYVGGDTITTGMHTSTGQPRIKLLKNVVQTVGSYGNSIMTWTDQEFNVNFPTFSTNQSDITINWAGCYAIGFEVTSDTGTGNTGFMGYILLNTTSNGTSVRRYGQGHGTKRVTGSTMMYLDVGDVLRVGVRNFTNGTFPFPQTTAVMHQMEFWAYRLG